MTENLIESNMERAILIASLCADRLGSRAGAWQNYHASEGLVGELVQDDLLRYARPGTGDPNFAVLFFQTPEFTDQKTIDLGEETVTEHNIVERYTSTINKVKGIGYKDTISHTFSRTTTQAEAFKVAAEVAVKVYAEASYAGVKGGAEASAKFTAEYDKNWGTSETHSDTVEREIELPADFEGEVHYEAVRSVDRVERTVKGEMELDYHISFVSGPMIPPANHPYIEANWDSIEQFIAVGSGWAAADKALYAEFINNQLSKADAEKIKALGKQNVQFDINFDNVVSQDIRIV